jgi:hypothetical protein
MQQRLESRVSTDWGLSEWRGISISAGQSNQHQPKTAVVNARGCRPLYQAHGRPWLRWLLVQLSSNDPSHFVLTLAISFHFTATTKKHTCLPSGRLINPCILLFFATINL